MFAGGALSWFVLMPLIALFGGDAVIFPGTVPISSMAPGDLWGSYIKYIGAGAVAAGGMISLVKTFPLIIRTFKQAMASMSRKHAESSLRTERDLPMPLLLGTIVVIAILIWLVPTFPVNPVGAAIVVIFGFFFASVSSRMVGLIGSSNNPVSGMAIATFIIATLVLKATGTVGTTGMVGAVAIGGIICIVAAIAGDTSQDLKSGYIVGATPIKQQIGELLRVVVSALSVGFVLYLLNEAWGYGTEELPAAQATMMKMLVEGIMNAELPWGLILTGVFIAVAVEILKVPVMPFAVGMYLPFSLSAGIMAGGAIRFIVERIKGTDREKKERTDRGVLFTSGLIAGEGIIGILLAVLTVFEVDIARKFSLPQPVSLIIFLGLLFILFRQCMKKDK